MANGFMVPKTGAQGIAQEFSEIKRQQAAIRGANDFESAVIGAGGLTVKGGGGIALLDAQDRVTTLLELGFIFQADPRSGAAVQISNGQILMWGNRDANPENFGRLSVDRGNSNTGRWFPPFSDGTGLENSVTVQGRRPGAAGNVWVFADGSMTLRVQDDDASKIGIMNIGAADIMIDSDRLLLYGLGTVSSDPNLVLDFPGGIPVLKLSTSSRRYKQDITTPDVDGEDVRQWEIRQWRDKAAVVEQGDDAPTHVGHIAEQIADVSPDCVVLDAEGRPNALRPNVMSAHVVALVQRLADQNDAQAAQITAQDNRIASLESTVADLAARLEALEAK